MLVVAAFMCLVPGMASAASAGATISALPESENLEGHAEFQYECPESGEFSYCGWFGQAAVYGAETECPSTYDPSHSAWLGGGEIKNSSGSEEGTFAFSPEGLPNEIKLCLYIDGNTEELVGESHPFNRTTRGEVLPAPPPAHVSYPASTKVWVSVKGCKFWPHVAVNGEKNIGGDITWVLYALWDGKWRRELGKTEEDGAFNAFTSVRGTYHFSARFLGDANLLPSSASSYVFHITGKECVPTLEESEVRSDIMVALENKVSGRHESLGPSVEGLKSECKRTSRTRFGCEITFSDGGSAWKGTGQIWIISSEGRKGWRVTWDYSLNVAGYPRDARKPLARDQ